jgi:hypothetical protein
MKHFSPSLIATGLIVVLSNICSVPSIEAHSNRHSGIVPVSRLASSVKPVTKSSDLEIIGTQVQYLKKIDSLVFNLQVKGIAGKTRPVAKGKLDGAPVLAYVFPTTLKPEDVGFGGTQGIVALAVTSHPDFNDTPLERNNTRMTHDNYGMIFHTHWVVLGKDERVPGGLAVREFKKGDKNAILPPTNPGLPMYLDSPGFSVVLSGNNLKVVVPAQRVNRKVDFKFDAVAAYMEVNTSDKKRPLLGVYQVYSVSSGNLSLPYNVQSE